LDCQHQQLVTTSGRGAARRAATFEVVLNGDEEPALVTKQGNYKADKVELRGLGIERQLIVNVNGEEFEAMRPENGFLNTLKNGFARIFARSHYKLGARQQRAYLARSIGKAIDTCLVKGNMGMLPSNMQHMVCIGAIALRRIARGGPVELANATTQHKCLDEVKRLLERKKPEIMDAGTQSARSQGTFTQLAETDESPEFSVNAEELMCMACAMQRCDLSTLTRFVAALMLTFDDSERELDNSVPLSTEIDFEEMPAEEEKNIPPPTLLCSRCAQINESEIVQP